MSCFRIRSTSARFGTRVSIIPGLHEPIVDRELWDETQLLLRSRAVRRAPRTAKSAAGPLTGKLFS